MSGKNRLFKISCIFFFLVVLVGLRHWLPQANQPFLGTHINEWVSEKIKVARMPWVLIQMLVGQVHWSQPCHTQPPPTHTSQTPPYTQCRHEPRGVGKWCHYSKSSMDNTLAKELKTESQYPWRNPSYSTRSVLGIESCVCLFFFFSCVLLLTTLCHGCVVVEAGWETVSITQIECGKHTDEGIIAWMPIPSTGSQLHHKKKENGQCFGIEILACGTDFFLMLFFFFDFPPLPYWTGTPNLSVYLTFGGLLAYLPLR
jgi:hypothetical protein